MALVYIVEDDNDIREMETYALRSAGLSVDAFTNSESFFATLSQRLPDLVLLDIMLPGEDGISVLRRLRADPATASVPVIMLTAKNTEFDRVQGLDAGADDYISKPFGMMELVARVRAVLRRTEPSRESAEYRVGELYVCPDRHEARLSGKQIQLTYKEFLLLCTLLENQGRVLTREVLMDKVWGLGVERENRTLDVHIRTLRQKLGSVGSCIQTVRNVGYRLEVRPE
jgi:two-component system alkaline phosphatase synthesis response regulator PhoP